MPTLPTLRCVPAANADHLLFDSCYTWLINFPIAFVLSRYTALPLPIVYLFVNGVDLLKCIIGFILVKKGVWVNNIVASSQDVPQAD